MNSCIYVGSVRHRRLEPVRHAFRYQIFMMYLDLAELDHVFHARWLWSTRRPALAWFRRADYLGDPAVPLDRAVRDLVAARTGQRPDGAIRVLTHPRYFGYVMNPVSFYYCHDTSGGLTTVVAEVTNTPWGERHAYVLSARDTTSRSATLRFAPEKALHVSPFMSMDVGYDWRFTPPGRRLAVHMGCLQPSGKMFDATLALTRREISGLALAATLARYPWMTARVGVGIYWQALMLKLKGAPVYDHPPLSRHQSVAGRPGRHIRTRRSTMPDTESSLHAERRS